MARDIASTFSFRADPDRAAAELASSLSDVDARVLLFFCTSTHDGKALSSKLRERFPKAEVIGCTTAGELTNGFSGRGAVAAMALSGAKVRRASASLARFDESVQDGMAKAAHQLGKAFGAELRSLDPKKHAGVMLVEGLKMHEEEANEAIGDLAPLISFVGGSAGDDLAFKQTRVFVNGEQSDNGAALVLMEMAVPFTVTKSCSFKPSGTRFTVTKADPEQRVIYEFDGKPVIPAYAEAVGVTPDKVDGSVFMSHPIGLMIDGQPWIRSPQRVLEDGGLKFYCNIREGMVVDVMNSTDLVGETQVAIRAAREKLGAPIVGGLTFNCILRRLELDAKNLHSDFLRSFEGMQTAGFHTYGESWLGHINQTLTALLMA